MATAVTTYVSEKSPAPSTNGPLVLVVDDDRDARTIYRGYLRAMGCRVVTAPDGNAAIDLAVLRRPDVIVMDLALPYMDGLSAIRHLRRQKGMQRVPIIALTAVPTSRESARRAGSPRGRHRGGARAARAVFPFTQSRACRNSWGGKCARCCRASSRGVLRP